MIIFVRIKNYTACIEFSMKKLLLILFYTVFVLCNAVSQTPARQNVNELSESKWISTPRPNPAIVSVTFEYALPSDVREARILIRNLTGLVEIAQSLDVSASKQVIYVSDLSPGVYLYSFEVEGRIILTRKMLVGR